MGFESGAPGSFSTANKWTPERSQPILAPALDPTHSQALGEGCCIQNLYGSQLGVSSSGLIEAKEGFLYFSDKTFKNTSGGVADHVFLPLEVPSGFRLLLQSFLFDSNQTDLNNLTPCCLVFAPKGITPNFSGSAIFGTYTPGNFGAGVIVLFPGGFHSFQGSSPAFGGGGQVIIPPGYVVWGAAQQVIVNGSYDYTVAGVLVKDLTNQDIRSDY